MRNKSNNNVSSGGGLGLSGVLTTIFVVLKLVGVIDWSWVWVLSPLWIGISFAILVVTVMAIIMFWPDKYESSRGKRKDKWKF